MVLVPEQDIEARIELLDERVLKEQGFGFGPNDGGFQARDAGNHHADARASVVPLEIARHPPLEHLGLADVQDLILGVEISVHPWQLRQGSHLNQQSFPDGTGLRLQACHGGRLLLGRGLPQVSPGLESLLPHLVSLLRSARRVALGFGVRWRRAI